jgi:hypothetical protein
MNIYTQYEPFIPEVVSKIMMLGNLEDIFFTLREMMVVTPRIWNCGYCNRISNLQSTRSALFLARMAHAYGVNDMVYPTSVVEFSARYAISGIKFYTP